MVNVFNVEVFFVVLRESLEAVIVVSVLLAFLKQGMGSEELDIKTYKKLRLQVYLGAVIGVVVCLIIGAAFIGTFYTVGKDIWGNTDDLWEGIFCIIATVLITAMGIPMLRINKMQAKWRVKIARALVEDKGKHGKWDLAHYTKKYAMFILPFITCMREGLEAVVFVGGVGLTTQSSARAFPLPVVCGLIGGITVGVIMYYWGSHMGLQLFLVVSTSILYLIGASLFSRGVWYFIDNRYNQQTGGDASEQGSGPGSYDISKTVYHINCCNPEIDNGWDVFNAILGWQNTGYLGLMLAYNLYWLFIIFILGVMLYEEKTGHLPFMKNLKARQLNPMYYIKNKKKNELTAEEEAELFEKVKNQPITATMAE